MRGVTHCRNCGLTLRSAAIRGRPKVICASCQRIAHKLKNRARYHDKVKPERAALAKRLPSIAVNTPLSRTRADMTIARGQVKRRCQHCATLYHLASLEAPCPNCGAHLVDHPTTFTEVSHVA